MEFFNYKIPKKVKEDMFKKSQEMGISSGAFNRMAVIEKIKRDNQK